MRNGLFITCAVCLVMWSIANLVTPLLLPLVITAVVVSLGAVIVRGRWD